MNPDARISWLLDTASDIRSQFIIKYQEGQVEHKGDLGDVPIWVLLTEMEHEALDQLAYAKEIRRRLNGDVMVSRDLLAKTVTIIGSMANQLPLQDSDKRVIEQLTKLAYP